MFRSELRDLFFWQSERHFRFFFRALKPGFGVVRGGWGGVGGGHISGLQIPAGHPQRGGGVERNVESRRQAVVGARDRKTNAAQARRCLSAATTRLRRGVDGDGEKSWDPVAAVAGARDPQNRSSSPQVP